MTRITGLADHRALLGGLMGLALLFGAAPGSAQNTSDEQGFLDDRADPYPAAREAFMAAETPEEGVKIVEKFIAAYPEHPEVGSFVEVGADVLVMALDDHAGAVALAEGQLERTRGPELRVDIQEVLLGLYDRPEYADRLERLVQDLYDPAAMTYVQHLRVIETAAAAESWLLLDKHAAAARSQANAEAFADAYPDRDFSEEYIAEAGRNRQGLLDTYAGWSAANQGDTKWATELYQRADANIRRTFFDLPDNELYRFWGVTLIEQGETDAGLEKLVLAALFGHDSEAEDAARETFAARRGDDDFDVYLWQMRRDHAPEMVDFSAVDYQDEVRNFADLRGRKATLLAFWFPT